MPLDSKIDKFLCKIDIMIKIKVISDTICPWCYIGKKELENAVANTKNIDFDITYKPFQLDPTMPPNGVNRKKYIERKFGQDVAKDVGGKIIAAGKKIGIDFNYEIINKTPNTLNSHRLIRWAEREKKQHAALEMIFYSYFTKGIDIGNNLELIKIAQKLDLDYKKIECDLDKDLDIRNIELEEWSYRDLGIAGVPTYIIDDNMIITGSQTSETFVALFNKINLRKSNG